MMNEKSLDEMAELHLVAHVRGDDCASNGGDRAGRGAERAAAKEAAVRQGLVADVKARGYHLTVGATGQKWLLRELTAGGAAGHDGEGTHLNYDSLGSAC